MATSTDCAADLLAPPNCYLESTPDVLFERVAADFAAPLARLVRAHEADPTACDLRDFIGRQPLEVQDDDFAIERLEALDEGVQSLQDLSCVDVCCDVRAGGRELGVVQSRELSRPAASAAQDMRGRDVVRHAIDPGPQAASSIEIWQLQALEAPRVSAAYMRHRARDLARRTQIRKGLNYAIGVPGVLYIAWCCWRYFLHLPMMVAGLALTLLPLPYVAFRWRHLASAAQVPEDAGVLDSLSFYRRELERQRDARRGNWRRWLPPVVPGLITVLTSFALELNPTPWALVAFEAILIVGGISVTVAFEEWSARRLQREIDALDSLVVKDSPR